ncbi:MAG: hypothetical protein AMJ38_03115 [Dehalococcoidia bacterium DG_22]|nr:MAG: hypothetical protein AMJ38_03115 [Dehalococcoidia bacterium DG_22]
MPAEVTWQLIGISFIPLILGMAVLGVALWKAKRRWLRVSGSLAGLLLLAYWALMVFVAAYPTIDQTTDSYKCYGPGGIEVECPPDYTPGPFRR